MRKIQSQGVHHITLVGADRQTSIDHSDGLLEAHKLRVERGDSNIAPIHLADAIEQLVTRSLESLSDDRAPKDPYRRAVGTSA